MNLLSSGDVGIKNDNPATALDVTGTITSDALDVNGAANITKIRLDVAVTPGSPSEGEVIYNSANDKLQVYTSAGWEIITSVLDAP